MATYNLKIFIKNCGQTAADGGMVVVDSLQGVASALNNYSTLYGLYIWFIVYGSQWLY